MATVHLISCPRLCSRLLVMLSKLLSCSDSLCSSLPCCKPSCSLWTVFASCSALSLPAKCFFSLLISCCCLSSSAYTRQKTVMSRGSTWACTTNHFAKFLTYNIIPHSFSVYLVSYSLSSPLSLPFCDPDKIPQCQHKTMHDGFFRKRRYNCHVQMKTFRCSHLTWIVSF